MNSVSEDNVSFDVKKEDGKTRECHGRGYAVIKGLVASNYLLGYKYNRMQK